VIVLQTVSLARYLDRSQIVRSSDDTRLQVQPNDWWGEPLGAMLGRVLADELSQRLPQSSVITESGAVSAKPGAVVELDVRRLDPDARGMLILQAQANVNFKDKRPSALHNFIVAYPDSPLADKALELLVQHCTTLKPQASGEQYSDSSCDLQSLITPAAGPNTDTAFTDPPNEHSFKDNAGAH